MAKLTFVVAVVLVCVDNIRASEDLEAAWEKYQVNFITVKLNKFKTKITKNGKISIKRRNFRY
jgi:hypothetical protein